VRPVDIVAVILAASLGLLANLILIGTIVQILHGNPEVMLSENATQILIAAAAADRPARGVYRYFQPADRHDRRSPALLIYAILAGTMAAELVYLTISLVLTDASNARSRVAGLVDPSGVEISQGDTDRCCQPADLIRVGGGFGPSGGVSRR
jgi:hypothetical protein